MCKISSIHANYVSGSEVLIHSLTYQCCCWQSLLLLMAGISHPITGISIKQKCLYRGHLLNTPEMRPPLKSGVLRVAGYVLTYLDAVQSYRSLVEKEEPPDEKGPVGSPQLVQEREGREDTLRSELTSRGHKRQKGHTHHKLQ